MSADGLLPAALAAAVPLWIEAARDWPEELRAVRRAACAEVIASRGDTLLFRAKRPGVTGEAFNRLAEGLALLAFAPGGVGAFGGHWEAT